MSSSMAGENKVHDLTGSAFPHKNQSIVTLQVRTLLCYHSDFSVFGREKKACLCASLTLEAAIALSLFIFASVCLILPMKMMSTERRIQAALEESGENLSRLAYLEGAVEKGLWELIPGAGESALKVSAFFEEAAVLASVRQNVLQKLDTANVTSLDFSESQILSDGVTVDIIANYQIRIPFPIPGIPPLSRTARCRRRAWVGLAGKDYDGSGEGGLEDDPIVYVGKNSTRYHIKRTCHYISNDLTAVSINAVGDLRNESGGKYRPCAVCGKAQTEIVYVMPSGSSYHTDENCKAIISYARAVRLSEVAYLGPCSYCGK